MTSKEMLPLEVDVGSVAELLNQDADFLLLDCREADEYQLVRIGGSTHIPMGEIPTRLAEIQPHREKPIIVHCHHGGRSLQVTHWLRAQGFDTVQNMTGGIDVWSQQIDPTLPRY